MTEQYRNLDDKPYDSGYLLQEMTIDHPVAKVWPQVLEIGSWMDAHQLETLAGKPGEVGHFEKVLPRELAAEVPAPRYHLYGIAHIIPGKLIALEVLPEKGGSYGESRDWASFDSILLTDLGGKTRLTFLAIDVYRDKSHNFQQGHQKKSMAGRQLLERYFANLKRLVDDAVDG